MTQKDSKGIMVLKGFPQGTAQCVPGPDESFQWSLPEATFSRGLSGMLLLEDTPLTKAGLSTATADCPTCQEQKLRLLLDMEEEYR
ncbi:pleckstrin homology domain-containing family F member 2 isoform X2 [Aotus nancymaae]|uniref:pleckstrin homology domain-containing family F member 2 isoform X2 n=1 Tax=Aotus nancymaae TaxID=37293 RepID=UPI0030FEC7A0